MSVTVTPRASGLSIDRDKAEPIVHADGKATLIDGRGQLLVLDTTDLGPRELNDAETFNLTLVVLKHTLASYAEGEWSRTVTERDDDRKPLA